MGAEATKVKAETEKVIACSRESWEGKAGAESSKQGKKKMGK